MITWMIFWKVWRSSSFLKPNPKTCPFSAALSCTNFALVHATIDSCVNSISWVGSVSWKVLIKFSLKYFPNVLDRYHTDITPVPGQYWKICLIFVQLIQHLYRIEVSMFYHLMYPLGTRDMFHSTFSFVLILFQFWFLKIKSLRVG